MPGPLSRVDVLNFPNVWPVSWNGAPMITVANLPATQPVSGTVTANINGTVPVSGTFWPATQPVSGTVGVSNFPAVQSVSQSGSWSVNQAGTWAVNAVQSGNWAVTVSGTVSLASGTSVSVSNFPATQAVSGTVSVSNFPASQAVTGTFWQATQPISAVSLPLPAGASTLAGQNAIVSALAPQATAAKQDAIIAALGGRLAVDDYRVPNAAAAGGIVPRVTTDVSAFIASVQPCNFFGGAIISRPDGVGAYVFLLNRTTIPASGSTINMAEVLAMTGYGGGGGASLVPDQVPDRYSVGLVIIVSTSIDTYTPVTGANRPKYIKARVL